MNGAWQPPRRGALPERAGAVAGTSGRPAEAKFGLGRARAFPAGLLLAGFLYLFSPTRLLPERGSVPLLWPAGRRLPAPLRRRSPAVPLRRRPPAGQGRGLPGAGRSASVLSNRPNIATAAGAGVGWGEADSEKKTTTKPNPLCFNFLEIEWGISVSWVILGVFKFV